MTTIYTKQKLHTGRTHVFVVKFRFIVSHRYNGRNWTTKTITPKHTIIHMYNSVPINIYHCKTANTVYHFWTMQAYVKPLLLWLPSSSFLLISGHQLRKLKGLYCTMPVATV